MKNTTRLCSTKPIVTVNGLFPGPTIYAREEDNVLIKVVNHVNYNVSIHWLVPKEYVIFSSIFLLSLFIFLYLSFFLFGFLGDYWQAWSEAT